MIRYNKNILENIKNFDILMNLLRIFDVLSALL